MCTHARAQEKGEAGQDRKGSVSNRGVEAPGLSGVRIPSAKPAGKSWGALWIAALLSEPGKNLCRGALDL